MPPDELFKVCKEVQQSLSSDCSTDARVQAVQSTARDCCLGHSWDAVRPEQSAKRADLSFAVRGSLQLFLAVAAEPNVFACSSAGHNYIPPFKPHILGAFTFQTVSLRVVKDPDSS